MKRGKFLEANHLNPLWASAVDLTVSCLDLSIFIPALPCRYLYLPITYFPVQLSLKLTCTP